MTTKIFTFEGWDTARLLSEWTPLFETDPSPFEIEEDEQAIGGTKIVCPERHFENPAGIAYDTGAGLGESISVRTRSAIVDPGSDSVYDYYIEPSPTVIKPFPEPIDNATELIFACPAFWVSRYVPEQSCFRFTVYSVGGITGGGYSDYIYDPAIVTGAKYDLLVTADFNIAEHEITVCMELKIEGSDTLHTHTAVLDYSNLVSYYPSEVIESVLAIPHIGLRAGGYDGNNWEALTFGIGEEAPELQPESDWRKTLNLAAAVGARVGDIGTKIVLAVENGDLDLTGAEATIEITRPGGVDTYTATVNAEKKTVEYIGKADDNLWPAAGTYCIRAVLTWSADGETTRRFATEDKFLVIT